MNTSAGIVWQVAYFRWLCLLASFSAYVQNCPMDIPKYSLTAAITSQEVLARPRSILPR